MPTANMPALSLYGKFQINCLFNSKINMHVLFLYDGCRKALEQTGEIRCVVNYILEAKRKGEINHDNVLYIVENINVGGKIPPIC